MEYSQSWLVSVSYKKIEISTGGTNSMPFLVFRRDHLRFNALVIGFPEGGDPGLMWGNKGTLWGLCNKFLPFWWGKCGEFDF